MGVRIEITRIETAKADLITALESKGVTIPDGAKLSDVADIINDINFGTISGLNWQGYFWNGFAYNENDVVDGWDGSYYICKKAFTASDPHYLNEAEYWDKIVRVVR